jgi:hypothetical protein
MAYSALFQRFGGEFKHVYLCSFVSICVHWRSFALIDVMSFSVHLRPGRLGLAWRLLLDYEDEDEDEDERQGGGGCIYPPGAVTP